MRIGPITIDTQACLDAGMSAGALSTFVESVELSYLLAVAIAIDPLFVSCILDGVSQGLLEVPEAISMTKQLVDKGEPLTEIRIVSTAVKAHRCKCDFCAGVEN